MAEQPKAPPKKRPKLLDELLLVEITADSVGKTIWGKPRQMILSRPAYERQKKDIPMKIIEVLKPDGVTMEQYKESLKTGKAAASTPKKAAAAPKKAAAKKPAASKAAPKSKAKPPAADPVDDLQKFAAADDGDDPIKAQLEAEGLENLQQQDDNDE